MRFRQIIHIEGKCLDDIMRLACVKSVEKTPVSGLLKFRFFAVCMAHPAPLQSAYTGDYLCEDYDGKFHVLTEAQMDKHKREAV